MPHEPHTRSWNPPQTATCLLGVVGALLAICAQAHAQAWTVEAIPVKHRFAAEVASSAEVALSPQGRLTVDERTNSLVVRDTPAAIAQVKALLAALDTAPQMLVLKLTRTTREELETRGVDVRWGVRSGGVAVGSPEVPMREGITLGVVLRAEDARAIGETAQTVRVLSGNSAQLFSGETRAIPLYGDRYGTSYGLQDVGDGFWVRPLTLPDGKVRVEISASASQALDEGTMRLDRPRHDPSRHDRSGHDGPRHAPYPGAISKSSVDTTVVLAPGDSVVVGDVDRTGEESRTRWLTGFETRSGSEAELFLLYVEKDPMGG